MQDIWTRSIAERWPLWLPPLIAAFYPYLLDDFHLLVARTGIINLSAALLLLAAFAVPALGLYFACQGKGQGARGKGQGARGKGQVAAKIRASSLSGFPMVFCD
ncbi:hypothetical protein V2S84_13075, partial [Azotobacter chroococcum]|nr:hypothetical protein [Azotobacter chroococcum]